MEKEKPLKGFIILSLVSLLIAAGHPTEASSAIPRALVMPGELGSPYSIVVDKSKQRLYLYKVRGGYRLLKEYPCSTGKKQGDKSEAGDHRTPEGIYFFIKRFKAGQIPPKYGAGAFVMNYPNFFDRRNKKTGGGIWLHGTNDPSHVYTPNDSRGCIVVTNSSFLELSKYITLYETPIVVEDRIRYIKAPEMEKVRTELISFVDAWRSAWERKKIDRYMASYSKAFLSGSMNWKAWRRHKRRLNAAYNRIRVEHADLKIIRHDSEAIVSFFQRYRSDRFQSTGKKKLFLKKVQDGWKILGEHFRRITPSSIPAWVWKRPLKPSAILAQRPSKRPREDLATAVRRFLASWKAAWERRDIEAYMKNYSMDFSSMGMNRRQWRRHKESLFRRYRSIKVKIGRISAHRRSGNVIVSFEQVFAGDSYKDRGRKTLYLRKEKGSFKILKEVWTPL